MPIKIYKKIKTMHIKFKLNSILNFAQCILKDRHSVFIFFIFSDNINHIQDQLFMKKKNHFNDIRESLKGWIISDGL